MIKKDLVIVIPIYRIPVITERFSLKCLEEVKVSYDKYIVKPYSLNFKAKNCSNKSFEDKWFKSKVSYGQLMANEVFYNSFLDYKYILIYQLDSLIFKNDFSHWINLDYDYYCSACLEGECREAIGEDFVGWGGASIRKVKSCLSVIQKLKDNQTALKTFDYDINRNGAEDYWWGIEAKKIDPSFKVIPVKESLKFSFDTDPKKYIKKGGEIPPMFHHGFLFSPTVILQYYKYLPFKKKYKLFHALPSILITSISYLKLRLNSTKNKFIKRIKKLF